MGSPVKKTVELFYDVISPYSWLAFEVLTRYKTKWNMDLQLKPFFLGGIMQGAGNRPPGLVPNKMAYMDQDLKRLGGYFRVPLKAPSDPADVMFNKGSLAAMRYVLSVDLLQKEKTEPISREFWMRVWSRDEDITKPESFLQAAAKAQLSDDVAKTALEKMTTDEIKNKLKANTQEALDMGTFGAPTIILHKDGEKHLFFGGDRFELMAHIMGEKWEGPLPELSKM
ncbi:glutathione S-transferase kappa 1-like [Lingula anatina]|uniref:Glutathione S-transferase kappa n=1 Tax=Lingula anatina TaxID=7574 RepID=A0A1S3JPG6_LINAN|nr:glutathione S-transferase kappa 1-like [Lingula anatina]|eukprot:XP_013412026.1 glutathione S-transferase kappa 1-like [Lingula anatina]